MSNKLKQYQTKVKKLTEERNQFKINYQLSQTSLEKLSEELSQLKDQHQMDKTEIQTITNKFVELNKQYQTEVKKHTNKINQLSNQLQITQTETHNLTNKMNQLKEQNNYVQTSISPLQSIEEYLDTFIHDQITDNTIHAKIRMLKKLNIYNLTVMHDMIKQLCEQEINGVIQIQYDNAVKQIHANIAGIEAAIIQLSNQQFINYGSNNDNTLNNTINKLREQLNNYRELINDI